jgi:uncharacterized membrane protein YkvA (DUF1232 family)
MKLSELKQKAVLLKNELQVLSLAFKHPRTPWYAKACLLLVLGYALSPVDLIPDFIPILGYLDDLILIPLGIRCAIRMIPPDVLAECRQSAQRVEGGMKKSWVTAWIIVFFWLLAAGLVVGMTLKRCG